MPFNKEWVALATVAGLATASAFAQDKLSKGDKEWMEKEVGAIITAQEKSLFESLDKDDRKLFKDLFWMRRDFDPTTPDNEFRKIYEQRMKAADDNFQQRGQKGHETDMGQILLLMGGPSQQVEGRAAGSSQGELPGSTPGTDPGPGTGAGPEADPGTGSGREGFGSDFGGGGGASQAVSWVYDPNPQLGYPDGLTIEFRQQSQFGFRIANRDAIAETLERVKERLVSNPSVNYARDESGRLRKADARFDPNSPAKLALKALQDTGQTSDAIGFAVNPLFFRSTEGQVYIPMDFVIEHGIDRGEATVFGAVENADGFTVYQFEEKAELTSGPKDHLGWEMPLQLQPGLYTLYIGIMDDASQVLGTQVIDLDVPDFDAGELTLSSILMFVKGTQTGEAMGAPGKAFMLGGYHFAPKREMIYTQSDQLSGVFNAYGYGLEGDKPNLTVQVTFFREGERRGATKDEPFMLQTNEMALTIFDIPLNLPNFQDPGNYKVEVKVTDHVTNKVLTEEIAFVMQGQQ